MNMTDMLLQMTLQGAWQLPQVSQSGQTSNSQSQQGSSFQDLLDQRREDVTQAGNEETAGKPEASQDPNAPAKPDQDQETAALEAAAVAAPLLLQNLIPVQETATVEAGAVEIPTIQAVTPETVLPTGQEGQTIPVQTQAETVLPQASAQQAPQVVQTQDTQAAPVLQGEVAQAAQPQTVEVAAPADSQNQAQQDLSQDLTQSAAPQSETEQFKDVTVESFQTPLFREVESTPVRVGDAETVDMTAPAKEVEKSLSDILKGAMDQGEQRLEIKLSPANLGNVTAEFVRSPEGVLHVVLHAESEQTAKLLTDHASSLGMMLQDSNRGEVRVQVAQPQENQSAWQHPDQEGGQQQQQQHSQQQNTPRQDAENFLHQLRLGLVQMGQDAV